MPPRELIGGPLDLFMLALGAAAVGGVLFVAAHLIMKAIGMDINEHADRTRQYRNQGFFEQMSAFHSDFKNIPVAIGAGGLFLLLGAILTGLGAGAWSLSRLLGL